MKIRNEPTVGTDFDLYEPEMLFQLAAKADAPILQKVAYT